jgi:MFS family permease
MTLEYNALEAGLSLAPLSLTMFAAALLAGRRAGQRRPAAIIRAGFVLSSVGVAIIIPLVPRVHSGWALVIPLAITGCGLGLLVSQLNNYTLAPVEEERVSEAAGVNSAAGSFGLSFGLAMAGGLMLAALSVSFTHMTENSQVIPQAQQQQIAATLENDAEIMSNSALAAQIKGEPAAVEAEVLSINNDARNLSLQIALLVPFLAGLLGFVNSLRMLRLPDQKPSSTLDG